MPAVYKCFYIFRHGECPLNVTGHIQGRSIDGELTERGKLQAEKVGRKLQGREVEIIVSSPMKRARQTADIVASYIGCPIIFDERFIEVDMGVAEGMHTTEVENQYGSLYQKWRNCKLEDTETRFPDGETKAEVRARVFEALNEYVADSSYTNLAVSAHGIIISQILLALGNQLSDIPNGTVLQLIYDRGKWQCNGFLENT